MMHSLIYISSFASIWSPLLRIRKANAALKTLHFAYAGYVCVPYDSWSKQHIVSLYNMSRGVFFEAAEQAVIQEIQTKSVYLKSKISIEVSTVE